MFVTIANLIPVLVNFIFDGIYISFWFFLIGREYYRKLISPLINEMNELKKKQDILYESMQKLKVIIDIDKDAEDDMSTNINMLKRDLDSTYRVFSKRLDKIEEEVYINESNISDKDESNTEKSTEESTEESTEVYTEEKDILPIQNHITFPHFTIFEESNYKPTKEKTPFKELKEDTRLISDQLAKYFNKKSGVCMTFNEVYTPIWEQLDSELESIDNKLRKLFGISENEDYEITSANLSKYLEPHLKKLLA
jgi:hypothetical protein